MAEPDQNLDRLLDAVLREAPSPVPPAGMMRARVEVRAAAFRRRTRARVVLAGATAVVLMIVVVMAATPRREDTLDLLVPGPTATTTNVPTTPDDATDTATTTTTPGAEAPRPPGDDPTPGVSPSTVLGGPVTPGAAAESGAPPSSTSQSPTTAATPTPAAAPTACRQAAVAMFTRPDADGLALIWQHRSGPACLLTGPPVLTMRGADGWTGATVRPPAGVADGTILVEPGWRATLRLRMTPVPTCAEWADKSLIYVQAVVAGVAYSAVPGNAYCRDPEPVLTMVSFTREADT